MILISFFVFVLLFLLFLFGLTISVQAKNGNCATNDNINNNSNSDDGRPNGEWRGYTTESESYLALRESRENEIMSIPGNDERWGNWLMFTHGRIGRKFTKTGFKLSRAPPDVFAKLQEAVNAGMHYYDHDINKLPPETFLPSIYRSINTTDTAPVFLRLGKLTKQLLEDLKPMHEQWANIRLKPSYAYGLRYYRNSSSLLMHYDKIETHIISSILHLSHRYDNDSQPWPLHIEDHDGRLHAINLHEGDLVFYESSRCLHGRLQQLHGQHYASIFLHYLPEDASLWNHTQQQVIDAVPPYWQTGVLEDHGSRFAGQGLTIDSLAAAGTPPRIVRGEFIHNNKSPHAYP